MADERKIVLTRTKGDAKGCPGAIQVVFHAIVKDAKNSNEQVEKDEDAKEELPSSFVDHPYIELVHQPLCLVSL